MSGYTSHRLQYTTIHPRSRYVSQIACGKCGHVGVASAKSLPHNFTCSQCGTSRRVEREHTERVISRERMIENVLAVAG